VPVGTGPEQDRVLVGRYNLATANAELLTTLLPAVWHVRSGEQGVETVSALVDLLVAEVIRPRPGSELIIERLAELVLIEVMRLTASSPASAPTGLLQGLSDPVLAVALRAMHADVARDWSIADLARTAVVSRSVFAARFAQTIGMTPMAYLLTWRMALAKEAIVRADRSHTQIALAVGYSSVSAFSTAFKRHVGRSPARFASGVRSAANGSSLPGS
jgi:transcriptional regulator GlxA family with amidase domain